MRTLSHLFEKNSQWSQRMLAADPDFFRNLAREQTPKYLWIGCSDSRVPANQILDIDPGSMFVHRNIANLVVHTDLNCLSVIQYAVEALKIEHIIVCGHYQCGGVQAALAGAELGLIENWLRHIQDVRNRHWDRLEAIRDPAARCNRLCELNVIEQVSNVCRTTIVRDAWKRGQTLSIHGWIYGLGDGQLRDLDMCITSAEEVEHATMATIARSDGPIRKATV